MYTSRQYSIVDEGVIYCQYTEHCMWYYRTVKVVIGSVCCMGSKRSLEGIIGSINRVSYGTI